MDAVFQTNQSNSGVGFTDTRNITLAPSSLFKENEDVGLLYVMSVDVDRLLAPSYEMHGLTPPNNALRYGGWERKAANNWNSSNDSFTLAGHSLGHWMSAAAVFYNAIGNEELLNKLTYVVYKLSDLQNESGSPYIGGCPEDCFIKLFNGDTASWSDNYWVPWYGIHKIYQGLLDAYIYTDNATALDVLIQLADWAADGTEGLTDEQMQEMMDVEYGGMNEIFAELYHITGIEKYLYTARRFTHDKILTPLSEGKDALTGMHANTQIPKIIGAAAIYEQAPDKYSEYRKACISFWDIVNETRAYAIGGNSIAEHFEAIGAETLGIKTCESCNTYNMMRLTEHLFSWIHDSKYFDWYEIALYNHILGQQEPKTGAKMYFVSLLPGHHRVYEKKYDSWWCCTGTGMENPARYTRCAYYEDGNELYVNLYIAGTCKWHAKKLTLSVEGLYPYSDKLRITVSGNASAAINLRAPSWLNSEMTVRVGNDTYSSHGGEYITVNRAWHDGDTIDITIPMSIHLYHSRSDEEIAFMYGPIVLGGDLGSTEADNKVKEYISNETVIDSVASDVPYITSDELDPDKLVTAISTDKLHFRLNQSCTSSNTDVDLFPFHELHHRFYSVYWGLNADSDKYEIELNRITIDKAEPDGQQDELGHALRSVGSDCGSVTVGKHMYYIRSVDENEGSYFEYTLKAVPNKDVFIYVRFYKGSSDTFNVSVNGHKLTALRSRTDDTDICDSFYRVPSEYVNGDSISVSFSAAAPDPGAVVQIRTTSSSI